MPWDVRGKTVLVTGATSGIGLTASMSLARRGARVVLVGRDPARTAAAVDLVAAAAGGPVTALSCDFASQVSIRHLADEALRTLPRIDVLVNNAGTVNDRRRLSPEGIELTFAVNHLGYFLLTNLLLERIIASAPARVVTVASIGHRRGTLDFADLGYARGYSIMKAYRRSKLANVLFARELARRLEGTGVTSNALHPGGVNTNIWGKAPGWARPVIKLALSPFFITAEEGGETIVQLVAEPELDGVTGKYFEHRKIVEPAPLARDEALGRRLWAESARLVGLPG